MNARICSTQHVSCLFAAYLCNYKIATPHTERQHSGNAAVQHEASPTVRSGPSAKLVRSTCTGEVDQPTLSEIEKTISKFRTCQNSTVEGLERFRRAEHCLQFVSTFCVACEAWKAAECRAGGAPIELARNEDVLSIAPALCLDVLEESGTVTLS